MPYKKQILHFHFYAIFIALKNILPFSEKFVHFPKTLFTYFYYAEHR